MFENPCLDVFFILISKVIQLIRIVVVAVFVLQYISFIAAERIIDKFRKYYVFRR